ncbi:HalOD1 output domain-containing protein [Haloprofundus salinisoli]|uniref:HalOD1 output domain-containing protein n=1 Tax=Haloprofundus salinisoli TaxID=2876193 RepID=UPI001CC9081F|nr:HalOD1 output domain-containing protein [Haloprofundus salinisoli]
MVGEVESMEHSNTEGGVDADGHANDTLGTSEAWYRPGDSFDLSVIILDAVADAADVDPLHNEFSPLYGSVDVNALETALFDPDSQRPRDIRGELAFDYEGFEVAVRADGRVSVSARD